jgi:hypothetical protein
MTAVVPQAFARFHYLGMITGVLSTWAFFSLVVMRGSFFSLVVMCGSNHESRFFGYTVLV